MWIGWVCAVRSRVLFPSFLCSYVHCFPNTTHSKQALFLQLANHRRVPPTDRWMDCNNRRNHFFPFTDCSHTMVRTVSSIVLTYTYTLGVHFFLLSSLFFLTLFFCSIFLSLLHLFIPPSLSLSSHSLSFLPLQVIPLFPLSHSHYPLPVLAFVRHTVTFYPWRQFSVCPWACTRSHGRRLQESPSSSHTSFFVASRPAPNAVLVALPSPPERMVLQLELEQGRRGE